MGSVSVRTMLPTCGYVLSLTEVAMGATLDELGAQAVNLPLREPSELIHRLPVSLEGEPEGTPE